VAITAIDAKASYMVLVAKRNGLRASDSGVRDIRRTLQLDASPKSD
jgi:hypothetical protein